MRRKQNLRAFQSLFVVPATSRKSRPHRGTCPQKQREADPVIRQEITKLLSMHRVGEWTAAEREQHES